MRVLVACEFSGAVRDAFAVLAGVRNYSTDPPIVPVSEPRGLPEDVAWQDNNIEYDEPGSCWLGDHSFSWLTLSELRSIDLCSPVTLQGMVSPQAEKNYRTWGWEPREWCQATTDPTSVHLKWEQPLCKAAPLLPKLIMALSKLGAPEDVRMVFGFDS